MGRKFRRPWRVLFVPVLGCFFLIGRSSAQFTQQGNALTFSAMPGASFGQSVSLSEDGNDAIVGASREFNQDGGAWILSRSGSPPTWSAVAHLSESAFPGMIGNAWVGFSVAISGDANTVIAGAPLDNNTAGAFWVFRRPPGGSWPAQGVKIVDQSINNHENLGWSVSLSRNGNTAIIGGPGMDIDLASNNYVYHHGAAFVYSISASGGVLQQTLDAGALADDDATQGWSVGISQDGSTAIVGGPFDGADRGSAWVYANTAGSWGSVQELGSEFPDGAWAGTSVALSGDGGVALLGGPFEAPYGAARIYQRDGGTWGFSGTSLVTSVLPFGAAQGSQGSSVSLSSNGLTALVGEPSAEFPPVPGNYTYPGRAWLYTVDSLATWSSPGQELVGQYVPAMTALDPHGAQGWAVALSADGSTAISGATGENAGTGASWVFARDAGAVPDLSQWVRIGTPCPAMYFIDNSYTFFATVLHNPFKAASTFTWSLPVTGGVASIKSTTTDSVTISTTPKAPLKFIGGTADLCLDSKLGNIAIHKCVALPIYKHSPSTNLQYALAQFQCLIPPVRRFTTAFSPLRPSPPGPGAAFTKQELAHIESVARSLVEAARAAQEAAPSGRK